MGRHLQTQRFETDKSEEYLANYEKYFDGLIDQPIRLLELGVLHGGSLELWADYFPTGTIVGLDVNSVDLPANERLHFYRGFQQDKRLLSTIAEEQAPDGFDIIIDDASHIGTYTKQSFWYLFTHHLKSGGVYVIEDWGTGYWDIYPDGRKYLPSYSNGEPWWTAIGDNMAGRYFKSVMWKYFSPFRSHQRGMVGVVKQIVDEVAMGDITHPKFGNQRPEKKQIKSIHIYQGQAFIFKAE